MYALPQSDHVNMYIPVAENVSCFWVLGVTFSWIVFFVRLAIFIFVCLNTLVIYVASLQI